MSITDRKQISFLSMIAGFAQLSYFGALSDEIVNIASKGIDTYAELTVMSKNDFKRIKKFFQYAESEITKLHYNTSNIMMLRIVLAICSDFLDVVQNKTKQKVWQELETTCRTNLSKNYSNFTDEIDKAVRVVELLNNWSE